MRRLVLLTTLLLTACVTVNTLPADIQPATACTYDFLKELPGIEDPGVYFVQNKWIVIVFGYRHADGKDQTHWLYVNKRPLDGRFIVTGALPEDLGIALKPLESKCQVMTGYDDSFVITGPNSDPYRWLVDMSKVPRS